MNDLSVDLFLKGYTFFDDSDYDTAKVYTRLFQIQILHIIESIAWSFDFC